ncbi:ORF117 [White spot syndrome virus]|uniref:ORF117 n=1 Tax=White spot syndrome virus TaxID=342409 RepID=A0A2D3I6G2_9VIRU|nr:ORF117 [White spot syndrome virus]
MSSGRRYAYASRLKRQDKKPSRKGYSEKHEKIFQTKYDCSRIERGHCSICRTPIHERWSLSRTWNQANVTP